MDSKTETVNNKFVDDAIGTLEIENENKPVLKMIQLVPCRKLTNTRKGNKNGDYEEVLRTQFTPPSIICVTKGKLHKHIYLIHRQKNIEWKQALIPINAALINKHKYCFAVALANTNHIK